jgi:hypothetical protein
MGKLKSQLAMLWCNKFQGRKRKWLTDNKALKEMLDADVST